MASYNYISYLEASIKENWNVLALADYKKPAITYGQLAESIYHLHSVFDASGLKRGDKVALLAKNSLNWAKVYLAVITYGATIVPLLPDFMPDDVHKLVNHSEANYLFVSNFLYEKLDASKFDNLKAIISLEKFESRNL